MYVAIIGYGVVGSGVAELFTKNHDNIVKRSTQAQLELKYILDVRDFTGDPNEHLFVKDFETILNDAEIGIVVETIGGIHPAYDYTLAALKAGKSVVTSNKELVATKGYELLKMADSMNVNYLFEASVGGGIPIIRPITQCLAANEINEVAGILNGTTNFILTKMIAEGMSFETALALAQENGYAEKDPTADVEGHDASRKVCILAALCFGKHVYPEEVYTEGISKVTLEDVEYARDWGGVIKLIGRAAKVDKDRISAMVSPAFVPKNSQLASVDDVFNGILVRGDAIGDVVFYGRGAGKMPTASAVVADVIDCAKHVERKKMFGWEDSDKNYVVNYLDVETALYIRAVADEPSTAIKDAEKAFGSVKTLTREGAPANEIAFVTPRAPEKELRSKLEKMQGIKILSSIRITEY